MGSGFQGDDLFIKINLDLKFYLNVLKFYFSYFFKNKPDELAMRFRCAAFSTGGSSVGLAPEIRALSPFVRMQTREPSRKPPVGPKYLL